MMALIFTYYVFVYDPVASPPDHDDGNVDSMLDDRHRVTNPIDYGLLRPFRSFLGRRYVGKLPISDRNKLENAFNKVRIHRYYF